MEASRDLSRDQFDLEAEDFSLGLNEIRDVEKGQPLAKEVNGHIYLFQDAKGPIVCTRTQFGRIARQLGFT